MLKTIIVELGLFDLSDRDFLMKTCRHFQWAYALENTSRKYPYPNDNSEKKYLKLHCYVDKSLMYVDLSEWWSYFNNLKSPDIKEMIKGLTDPVKINAIYDLLIMNAAQHE